MPTSDFGVTPDSKPHAQWDGVGVFYTCFSVAWTAILLSAMIFLYVRRDMPILRVRGLLLSFCAVGLLHCYWLCVELGYVYGVLMPESAEFWIMGIWFPFGIALFHASNSRFLYVAEAQQSYLQRETSSGRQARLSRRKTLFSSYRKMNYSTQMVVLVSCGMGLQVFLATQVTYHCV